MKEKIGLLLRVSSKPQETDGTSLSVQKEIGIRVGKSLGLQPIVFDEGVQSSFNVEINQRPILVELLDEITKKNINKVWVLNTDRLGRYSNSWYSILRVFLEYRVQLYIGESNKTYDLNNSVDKLTIGVLSLISQYDNELRRMRSVLGKRNSLRNGQTYVGSTIPFGYNVKDKMLIPNDVESKELKNIYKMYSEGKSTNDIKTYLDIKTDLQPRRTKMGWNLGTIQKMLRNTLYIGYQDWEWKEKVGGDYHIVDSIRIKVPPLVDKKLWNKVQLIIDSNTKNRINEKINDSLLDGFIYCKSCNMKLLTRRRTTTTNRYYSCRSSEYKWKSPKRWKGVKDKCSLTKSPRVDESDNMIMNHILLTLKNSKSVREKFKSKTLNPKFDENKNVKKIKQTKERYLRQRKTYLDGLEDQLIQVEFEIRTKELSESKGKKLVDKFTKMIDEIEIEISRLEKEMEIYTNSSRWIDWLDRMYKELDKVENYTIDKKRKFLNEYIERIDVDYISKKQSHQIEIEFKLPLIDDSMNFTGTKDDGRKDYEIKDGKTTINLIIPNTKDRKTKMSDSERGKLNKMIIELKVGKSLSLNQICNELNQKKLLTPTNKKWDKSKLSSYYNQLKIDVGK